MEHLWRYLMNFCGSASWFVDYLLPELFRMCKKNELVGFDLGDIELLIVELVWDDFESDVGVVFLVVVPATLWNREQL